MITATRGGGFGDYIEASYWDAVEAIYTRGVKQ